MDAKKVFNRILLLCKTLELGPGCPEHRFGLSRGEHEVDDAGDKCFSAVVEIFAMRQSAATLQIRGANG